MFLANSSSLSAFFCMEIQESSCLIPMTPATFFTTTITG
ncbi:hypothetical protein C943_03241 [Mariniradius saccharolyticus AK6]|uniref:Uncharacterized protein n=1 Tax=Mariniradius saccharolyticus AK6 TaxID=1239962 RepID=M7XJE1_9BACT|nr:hypothetical protein C943_03241 [Mariniradius saccharolyticus AK6]